MPPPRKPDAGTRERLLQAGLCLARDQGLKATTVRAVAERAGANLGTFVYHFRTREAFIEALIERLYGPMFQQLQLTADHGGDPLHALRSVLLQLVRWVVDNRAFIAHLVLDASAGEAAAQRFLRTLDQRHPVLLLALIRRAQAGGQLGAADPLHQMLFLMSTTAAPVMLFHLLGRRGVAPPALVEALSVFTTDMAQIECRLDWALRGLSGPSEKGRT